MKLRILLVALIMTVSLLLSSCITSRLITVEVTCDQFNQNPNAMSEFTVAIGDKITVKLCSNASTGFNWDYEITGDDVLMEEDYDFEEPADEGMVGAAGKEVWTFEATEVGTTEIRMEYSRPSDSSGQAEWTYVLNITVEEFIESSQ